MDYSHNFVFRLRLQRTSPTAIAAIFKQAQETDLSVSAGERALQSSKPRIWVMHCTLRGKCAVQSGIRQLSNVGFWGKEKTILKQWRKSLLWDKNRHMLSFFFATS